MAIWDLHSIRAQFPALQREQNGRPVAYFDGPAGSQVPSRVAEAVSRYLLSTNANHDGPFATSRESDALLEETHQAVADFMGAADSDCISFGPNMTTLTFALSRALGRTWRAGDEVIVTQLDHDANVTPWVLAARDAGALVRQVRVRAEDCTLDLERFSIKAVGSNPFGGRGLCFQCHRNREPGGGDDFRGPCRGGGGVCGCRAFRPASLDRCVEFGLRLSGGVGVQIFRPARRA